LSGPQAQASKSTLSKNPEGKRSKADMTTKKKVDLLILTEAIELADWMADAGADEFTQWLAAFLHINKPRKNFTENEIMAAWEDFQAYQATLPEED
jgi:hypothetical protein